MSCWPFFSRCIPWTLTTVGLLAQTTPPTTLPVARPLRAYTRGFREPVRLATDGSGHLYVADPARNLITVRDESGRVTAIKSGFLTPLGLAVDASGRIFVSEAGAGRVRIFTSAWVPAGALGQGDGEFQLPNHIQITPDGRVFVVDSRANLVKVYGTNGVLLRQFGGYGSLEGQFDFPAGLAVTPAGEIVISDQGNERMQVFDSNFTFVRAFGKPNMIGTNATFGRVQGLLSDSQGRIYMADAFRGVVTVMTTAGTSLGAIGAFGSGPGELQGPSSLVLDRNNRLFVATPGNTRVEVFGLDTYTDPSILDATLVVEPGILVRNRVVPVRRGSVRRIQVKTTSQDPASDAPDWDLADGLPSRRSLVSVLIKMPGVDPTTLVGTSILGNGVPVTLAQGAFIGDFDGDGSLEYRVWFDEARLAATMADGDALLLLSGRLTDGRVFESMADVKVTTLPGGAR